MNPARATEVPLRRCLRLEHRAAPKNYLVGEVAILYLFLWPPLRLYTYGDVIGLPPITTERALAATSDLLSLIAIAALPIYVVSRAEGPKAFRLLGLRTLPVLRALSMGFALLAILLVWSVAAEYIVYGWEQLSQQPIHWHLRIPPAWEATSLLQTATDFMNTLATETFFRAYLLTALSRFTARTWLAAGMASLLSLSPTLTASSLIYSFVVAFTLCAAFQRGWPLWLIVLCSFLAKAP